MRFKDLKISIKLAFAAGIVLTMLLIIGMVSINNSLKYARATNMAQFVLAKEVDHYKWTGDLQNLFIQNLEKLEVEVDSTKCSLGSWYYNFINSKDFKKLPKDLKENILKIEKPHEELHKTAIEIEKYWKQKHVGLQRTLLQKLDDHRKWSNEVMSSLLTRRRIDVETDPTMCAFGKWLASEECKQYSKSWAEFQNIINEVRIHHENLHKSIIDINNEDNYVNKINIFNDTTISELENVAGYFQEIISLEENIVISGEKGLDIFNTQTIPALNDVRSKINVVIDTLNKEKRVAFKQMLITIIIFILIFVMIIVGMVFYAVNKVTKPITKIAKIANDIADGDLEIKKMEIKSKDELGMLMESFNRMLYSLKYKLDIIKQIAEGAGDFTINVELASDKDIFGKTIAKMLYSLNDILGQVNSAVGQISSGSNQIAQASQTLSQGATEQASSLEEITSSITEISSQVKLNAENAIEASGLSKKAMDNAEKGNDQMQQLVTAMEDINKSADEIKRIVKVIDDIAFQTNLLALNANVEAARAGKYGKGFAVVAEEVRNLASRSTGSVKETTTMVEQAISNIGIGNNLVEVTSKQLEEIVNSANKAADLVEEIAIASKEQTQGLEQISQGLAQIDQVTQSNTANAEESASASEELAGQAQQLGVIVSKFKLVKDNIIKNEKFPLNLVNKIKDGIKSAHKNKKKLNDLNTINEEENPNDIKYNIKDKSQAEYIDYEDTTQVDIKAQNIIVDPKKIIKLDDSDFGKF